MCPGDSSSRIEDAQPAVGALGVTDYFCIQTYREALRRKRAGNRLPGVELLFPNVELRLDIKTGKQKPINLHLLFSPDDPNHETQIERILGSLTYQVDTTVYRCQLSEFARLGKDTDPKQTDEKSAIRLGAMQFKTSLNDVRSLFKNEKWMRENCLVAVASKSGDGTSGLQEDDSYATTRRDIEGFADIIFGGNPKQRAYWLGEIAGHDRVFIENTYRSLKPCLHGSDAHTEDEVTVAPLDRFCWIKGDLTFETLRQAVIEPADRVRIGEEPPAFVNAAEAIGKVQTFAASWMGKSSIDINAGLVAIVGARGSGKTALADVIATGAGASASEVGDASFLRRAADHVGPAAVQLTWGDGTVSSRIPLGPLYGSGNEPVLARYLSQHFPPCQDS